jgi:predicted RNA polymerase sigma factor
VPADHAGETCPCSLSWLGGAPVAQWIGGYQYFHSTRADLLRRLGRADEARATFERALELAKVEPERRFLQRRIEEVSGTARASS